MRWHRSKLPLQISDGGLRPQLTMGVTWTRRPAKQATRIVWIVLVVFGSLWSTDCLACSCRHVRGRGFLSRSGVSVPVQAAGMVFLAETGQRPDILLSTSSAPPDRKVEVVLFERVAGIDVLLARVPDEERAHRGRCKFAATEGARRYVFFDKHEIGELKGQFKLWVSPTLTFERSVAAGGTCEKAIRVAAVPVVALLPKSFGKAQGGFYYRVFVDGKRWLTWHHMCESVELEGAGTGMFEIIAVCDKRPGTLWRGTTLGRHALRVDVVLPGTEAYTATATATIDLKCDAPR